MGVDGVKGMGELKKAGAITVAQDEKSSIVWGMPGNAVKAGYVEEVVSLEKMSERIMQIVSENGKH